MQKEKYKPGTKLLRISSKTKRKLNIGKIYIVIEHNKNTNNIKVINTCHNGEVIYGIEYVEKHFIPLSKLGKILYDI